MVLLGFLTFFDPPREDAAQVLEALRRDGIVVKILIERSNVVKISIKVSRARQTFFLLCNTSCAAAKQFARSKRIDASAASRALIIWSASSLQS